MDPDTRYSCILADPPWHQTDRKISATPKTWNSVTGGDAEVHYETMMLHRILDMPVAQWAAPRAHLWLWSLNSTMESAYKVVRAWGFEPLSLCTWVKTSAHGNKIFGMGQYMRLNTEQLIFAVRGKPALRADKPWMGSYIEAPRTGHSTKPDVFYDLIEHVTPASPRLELFARRPRKGWVSMGKDLQSPDQKRLF